MAERGSRLDTLVIHAGSTSRNGLWRARPMNELEMPFQHGHWGGYRVIPDGVEFFESRPDRLHDRTRYVRGSL